MDYTSTDDFLQSNTNATLKSAGLFKVGEEEILPQMNTDEIGFEEDKSIFLASLSDFCPVFINVHLW
ncbi:MAG: hypothetical protein ABI891_07435 [Acidobacteriota bacterium]